MISNRHIFIYNKKTQPSSITELSRSKNEGEEEGFALFAIHTFSSFFQQINGFLLCFDFV